MPLTAAQIRQRLAMQPHPEGGHYVEVFRASEVVRRGSDGAERVSSTAIYFLLEDGDFSAFHRVSSDEAWHHYLGDPVELSIIDASGLAERRQLGSDLLGGQEPLSLVPAGAYQAARLAGIGCGFALCGCTVAPGFDFSDFELPTRAQLIGLFPQHEALICQLTRSLG